MPRSPTPPCINVMQDYPFLSFLNMTSSNRAFNLNLTFTFDNNNNSLPSNMTFLCDKHQDQPSLTPARIFYCYFTPVLIVLGMLGNLLSLKVFLSRAMRRLNASVYLSALSISDSAALLFYVLVDWLRRGGQNLGYDSLNRVSVFEMQGLCQAQMYLSYVTRFLSAWIIVVFTIERYMAVCHPLKRRGFIFGSRSSHEILLVLLVTSFLLMVYKPVLTGRYEHRVQNIIIGRCSRNRSHSILSFVLDSIFAMSITLIPFLIISLLNTLIIIRLYHRHRRIRTHIVPEESVVRMEFTVIFLVISFVFIALNLPFFCIWCNRFLKSFYKTKTLNDNVPEESDNAYLLTRLVFYLSYSINFFLYSVSGACFRRELQMMFLFWKRKKYNNCIRLSPQRNPEGNSNNSMIQRSWV